MSFHNFVTRTAKPFPHPSPPADTSSPRSSHDAAPPRSSLDGTSAGAGRSPSDIGKERSPRHAALGMRRSARTGGEDTHAALPDEESSVPNRGGVGGPGQGGLTSQLQTQTQAQSHMQTQTQTHNHSLHPQSHHHHHGQQLKPLDAKPAGHEAGARSTVHRLNPFESVRTRTLPGSDVSYNHDSPGHGKAPGRGFQRFTNVKLPPSLIPLQQTPGKLHPDPLAEGKWDDAGVETILNLDAKGWHTQVFHNLKPTSRSDVTALAMWLKETLQMEKE
jgi:hypothetical protein